VGAVGQKKTTFQVSKEKTSKKKRGVHIGPRSEEVPKSQRECGRALEKAIAGDSRRREAISKRNVYRKDRVTDGKVSCERLRETMERCCDLNSC